MTYAVCYKCGKMKFGAFNTCLISDCYNSRLTTIRIPENKESKKMVKPPSKSNGRRELDGDRPASEEVVQVDSVREEFRDSSNEVWNG